MIIADGARSQLGRKLGREWHRDTAYGVAARGYIKSERHDDPWISSHLELRGDKNEILSGYGWIFPLANGEVNVGVGTLATHKRPAEVNLRALMNTYADQQREDWKLSGDIRLPWSFLLPMGGAVSGIAGKNFMFIGDAAGCVNPLNGEGIDYGLETGRLAAEMLDTETDFSVAWPAQLALTLRLSIFNCSTAGWIANCSRSVASCWACWNAFKNNYETSASSYGQLSNG